MSNQENQSKSIENKKNRLPVASLIVSVIVLLFGNNVIIRLFSGSDEATKKDDLNKERHFQEDLFLSKKDSIDFWKLLQDTLLNSNNTSKNDSIFEGIDIDNNLRLISDEEILDSFLLRHSSKELNKLVKTKDFSRALRILDLAKNKTVQPELIKQIENKKKSIFLIMEKGFDNVYFDFPCELILTEYEDKYGLYSRNGKEIIAPFYDDIDPVSFSPLLLTSKNDKYGFLDEHGKEIFTPIFSEVEIYFYPLILVKENDKYGFINSKGLIVIAPSYSDVMPSNDDGLILVNEFDEWGAIDTLGRKIIDIKYDTIGDFDVNGIAYAELQGERVFLNKSGKIVKNPAFE